MITSFVVRLVVDDLDNGLFAGEVQHVASGRRSVIRSADELLGQLLRLGAADVLATLPVERWSSDAADEATD